MSALTATTNAEQEHLATRHINGKMTLLVTEVFALLIVAVNQPHIQQAELRQSTIAVPDQASRPVSSNDDLLLLATHEHAHLPHVEPATGLLSPPDEPLQGVEAPSFLPSTQVAMAKMMELEPIVQPKARSHSSSIKRKPVAAGAQNSIASARDSRRDSLFKQSTHSEHDPAIRFALDQITIDQAPVVAPGPPAVPERAHARSLSSNSRMTDDLNMLKAYVPQLSTATAVHYLPAIAGSPKYVAPTVPWRDPRHSLNAMNLPQHQDEPDILLPYEQSSPHLRFLPAILRPLLMGIYILLCILMLAALVFSGIWSGIRTGLYDYTRFGGSRYFIFEYLPTLCGMLLLLWLFQIQIALQRVAPFIAMASASSKSRSEGPHLEMQVTNFMLPKVSYFRAGQPVLGVCMIIFWLQIFTVPLLACVYNVYFYGDSVPGHWRWMTVQGIVWTLVALYGLLIVALILLSVWLFHRKTGLKWDPKSLSDLIILLDRSNISHDYAESEIFDSPEEFRRRLLDRSDRIGYWHTTRHPADIFYGIGEEGAPTRKYSLEEGRIRERMRISSEKSRLLTSVLTSEERYQSVRRRYIPWYLMIPCVLLWCALASGLYIAFLVVSFVNHAVLRGFLPLTPVAPDADGFSSTNFLYSFVPAVIGQVLFLCTLTIDLSYRRLQPYASLSDGGSTAQKTILLDYPAQLPFFVTIKALLNRDLRVAWFSFLSLMTAAIPVLAGGCFWAQFYIPQQQVRVAVDRSAYYALCVFLALLACSMFVLLFGLKHRRLPHANTTLAEQISWLYQSRLLNQRSPHLPADETRHDMIERLVTSGTYEKHGPHGNGGMGRFAFGRFVGRDRQYHLGIERLQPEDSRYMIEHKPAQDMRDSGIETETHPALSRPVASYPTPYTFTYYRTREDRAV